MAHNGSNAQSPYANKYKIHDEDDVDDEDDDENKEHKQRVIQCNM